MVKDEAQVFRNFITWALNQDPEYLPAFSLFTLIELRRNRGLFDSFVEFFHPFPAVLLKGYEELLEEEVAHYPDPSDIDPCSIAFTPLGGEGNKLSNIPLILDRPELVERERYWNDGELSIVEGMVSLVPNYPPDGATYTQREIRTFIEIAGFSQLAMRQRDFAEAAVRDGVTVEMDAFPSLKASLYTAFHKFYADRTRVPSRSDGFDIIISAATPYVEAIVTENHQAEALRKIQRLDPFLDDLAIFTLRDLRNGL
jgi:hypothetical protein